MIAPHPTPARPRSLPETHPRHAQFASAIYEGVVTHERREPAHAFRFPLCMVYLDLAEVDAVLALSRLWGREAWRPARFRERDYLQRDGEEGARRMPLHEGLRALVRERTGRTPTGPIRMLTHARYFGYIFNPVTFYYCFDERERLDAIVAEITNTPWKQRHAYVLDARHATDDTPERPATRPEQIDVPFASTPESCADGARRPWRWRFTKDFHVSPFLRMGLGYDWTFSLPADRVFVHMNLWKPDRSDGSAPGRDRSAQDRANDDQREAGTHGEHAAGTRDSDATPAPPHTHHSLHPRAEPREFWATLTMRRREMSPAALRRVVLRYPLMTARVIGRIHFEALRLWLKGARVEPHPDAALRRDRQHGVMP